MSVRLPHLVRYIDFLFYLLTELVGAGGRQGIQDPPYVSLICLVTLTAVLSALSGSVTSSQYVSYCYLKRYARYDVNF